MGNQEVKKNLEKIEDQLDKKEELSSEKSSESTVEKTAESLSEVDIENQSDAAEEIKSIIVDDKSAAFAVSPHITSKQKRAKKIDDFLSSGLDDVYLKMNMSKRAEFKEEGERAVEEINTILNKTKYKVKKIIEIIRKWLSIIPGVSKIFLEQEAKIRTDKIIKLKNKS